VKKKRKERDDHQEELVEDLLSERKNESSIHRVTFGCLGFVDFWAFV
jgi:hypothetical protein